MKNNKGRWQHTRHLFLFYAPTEHQKMNISSFFDHLNFSQIQNEPDFSILSKMDCMGGGGGGSEVDDLQKPTLSRPVGKTGTSASTSEATAACFYSATTIGTNLSPCGNPPLEAHAASHSSHSAHSSHSSHASAGHILLLFGDLRHHGLGSGEKRRDSGGVQQCGPHHLHTAQQEMRVRFKCHLGSCVGTCLRFRYAWRCAKPRWRKLKTSNENAKIKNNKTQILKGFYARMKWYFRRKKHFAFMVMKYKDIECFWTTN